MADRLRRAAEKKGISSAKRLYEASVASGIDATMAFCRNIWYGVNPPITTNVAPILDMVGLSFDEYVWGRGPKKFTREDLLAAIGSMIESEDGTISDKDPTIVEAAQILMRIKDDDKKAAVLRMLRAFVGGE